MNRFNIYNKKNSMSNTYKLINSEGDIFVVYFKNKKIIAKVLLEDGSGKISFEIQKFLIIKYLNNEIKLNYILEKSFTKTVDLYNYKTKSTSQIIKKRVGRLSCGDDYYVNLPEGMIMSFDKRVELAVRVNHLVLDFEKIMKEVRNYYFLKEKNELLYFTFGDNNPLKIKYEKQLEIARNYLESIDVPFIFASYDEVKKLNLNKVCLKECGLSLEKIVRKNLNSITNREFNYMVYRLSDLIVDLNRNSRFWSKKAKNKYIFEYKDHYYSYKRNIVIDDILK